MHVSVICNNFNCCQNKEPKKSCTWLLQRAFNLFSLTHPPVEICTERCCALSRRIRSLFVWKSIYKGSLRILYTWTTFMFLFRGPANRSSYLLIRPKDQKMQMNFGMPFLPTFIPSCFLLMEAFLKNRELLSCI